MRSGRFVAVIGSLAAFVLIGCGGGTGTGSECEGVDCSGHGRCAVRAGEAVCLCEAGFVADGLECRADPCRSFVCDTGYQDNDQDGSCNPTCAFTGLSCPEGEICSDASGLSICVSGTRPPLFISFHWHMHQPIYWPYESIVETEANNRMGYSVYTIHHDRGGPDGDDTQAEPEPV